MEVVVLVRADFYFSNDGGIPGGILFEGRKKDRLMLEDSEGSFLKVP